MKAEKILVVDDESRIVENISRCLKREGFQVSGAQNGLETLSLIEREEFDLILLDISMPKLNGYETMERIFQLNAEMIIIIMTGFASVESAVKAIKQGAWDYLKKPFEYAELIKTVKNALSQARLIADKKDVSARLKASEIQYESMVNNSPDLIFTLDEQGRFTFVNNQFETLLGFQRKDLIGSEFENLVHDEDQSKVASFFPVQAGCREISFRFKKAKKAVPIATPYASNYAYINLKASPLHLPAHGSCKEARGIYAVARDMTVRINLEAQLRQSQKMEAIGTLAGGIAHDFNNILMGIQGYASLVKNEFDRDSVEYKRLSNIDEYVASGAEMARQLLGFAQKSFREAHMINLNYLLKMSAKMFSRTKKDIRMDHRLEKKLWGTVVNEGQIKQVLLNLFVNAWHAMPKGGTITISSENVHVLPSQLEEFGLETPGPYVKIGVSDTGIGMDKETITQIFDPFFTTKERGQGTGLGLATAYGIVQSHKGVFKVTSQKGEGSSFMFYLPAQEAEVRSARHQEDVEKIINGRGMILLVDDEKGVVEVCSEMIKTLGYDVKTAMSGIEAVQLVEKNKEGIDLIILDMIMPEMGGYETYKQIRQIRPESRVLISSGYSKEDEINRMMENGCCGFIRKPFDVAMLSEKIDSVFNSEIQKARV